MIEREETFCKFHLFILTQLKVLCLLWSLDSSLNSSSRNTEVALAEKNVEAKKQ